MYICMCISTLDIDMCLENICDTSVYIYIYPPTGSADATAFEPAPVVKAYREPCRVFSLGGVDMARAQPFRAIFSDAFAIHLVSHLFSIVGLTRPGRKYLPAEAFAPPCFCFAFMGFEDAVSAPRLGTKMACLGVESCWGFFVSERGQRAPLAAHPPRPLSHLGT